MTDPVRRATDARSRTWASGRAAPREYWAWAFSLVAVGFALDFFLPANKLSGFLTIVLVLAQVRRLHDAGRTGWWALAAQGGPMLVLAPMLAFYPDLAFSLGGLAELVGIIWIGLLRQDPSENRFGPPPGQKPVADTFS